MPILSGTQNNVMTELGCIVTQLTDFAYVIKFLFVQNLR